MLVFSWSGITRLRRWRLCATPQAPESSPVQPGAKDREHLLGVNGLRQIVPRAGLDALLAVALHGLGGDRDDRQVLQPRDLADLAHRLHAVHLRSEEHTSELQ